MERGDPSLLSRIRVSHVRMLVIASLRRAIVGRRKSLHVMVLVETPTGDAAVCLELSISLYWMLFLSLRAGVPAAPLSF